MMEVPSTPWLSERPPEPEDAAPVNAQWQRKAGRIEHVFTHFRLELEIWRAKAQVGRELRDDGDYRWVALSALADEALPSVMRKIVAAMTRS
jgi:A/G-specific adenine glycosylase